MRSTKPFASAVLFASLALAACDSEPATIPEPVTPVASVTVTAPRQAFLPGEQVALTATPKSADGTPLERVVTWTSEHPAFATVSAAGMVTAIAPGQATIRATSEGKLGTTVLNVLAVEAPPPPPPLPVTEVIIAVTANALEVGEPANVTAQLKLASGEIVQRPVTWSSSAPQVAEVVAVEPLLARVTARSAGTTTITATCEGVQASVSVQIAPTPTHDLLYARSTGPVSEIFHLGLVGAAQPTRINAGNVSREPSASPDGSQLVFAVSQTDLLGNPQHDLYIVNRDGLNMRWLTRTPGMESDPTWSPDGTRILFHGTDENGDDGALWSVKVDGTGLTNLTALLPADVSNIRHPAWSPDGNRIAFIAARGGAHKLWVMNADGTNAQTVLADFGFDQSPTWSPTGHQIAISRYNNLQPAYGWDILIVQVADGTTTRLALLGDQLTPAWSPDGAYIAFAGTQIAGQGQQNLYTMRPDGTLMRLRTSNPQWGGGNTPTWIARR